MAWDIPYETNLTSEAVAPFCQQIYLYLDLGNGGKFWGSVSKVRLEKQIDANTYCRLHGHTLVSYFDDPHWPKYRQKVSLWQKYRQPIFQTALFKMDSFFMVNKSAEINPDILKFVLCVFCGLRSLGGHLSLGLRIAPRLAGE